MNKLVPTIKLTKTEANKLCDQARKSLGDAAECIYKLHEGEGWKAIGYDTFKQMCRMEFGHSDWWGRNQAKIAQVRKALEAPKATPPQQVAGVGIPTPAPRSDHALTELSKVPEADRQAVLEKAADASDGKPVTAKAISEAVKATTKKPRTKPAGDKPAPREPGDEQSDADVAKQQVKIWADAVGRWLGQSPSIDEYRGRWPGPKGDQVVKLATQFYEALKNWRREIK